MVFVWVMHMPVMQVIVVITMLDGSVATIVAVSVVRVGVCMMIRHLR